VRRSLFVYFTCFFPFVFLVPLSPHLTPFPPAVFSDQNPPPHLPKVAGPSFIQLRPLLLPPIGLETPPHPRIQIPSCPFFFFLGSPLLTTGPSCPLFSDCPCFRCQPTIAIFVPPPPPQPPDERVLFFPPPLSFIFFYWSFHPPVFRAHCPPFGPHIIVWPGPSPPSLVPLCPLPRIPLFFSPSPPSPKASFFLKPPLLLPPHRQGRRDWESGG